MKKVLVSLLVLAVAVSGAFAVSFTGEFVAGYQFNWDHDGDFETHIMGQDGDDSNTTKLVLAFADDNGYWDLQVRGALTSNYRTNGNLNINFDKLIWGSDTDVKLQFGFVSNDNVAALRAYHNTSGNNYDRIRTNGTGLVSSLIVGYGNLIQVKVAGTPLVQATEEGSGWNGINYFNASQADITVSALTKPINGLAISAGWIYAGNNGTSDNYDSSAVLNPNRNGNVAVAADVNIGAIAGLDFDLGVSATYKYNYTDLADIMDNIFAAEVYFGMDFFSVAVEYGLFTYTAEARDTEHYLWVGADFDVTSNVALSVWTGADTITDYAGTWFVGGKVDYSFYKNMSFGLGVEYSAGDSYEYDNAGFNIVPTFSVSF